MLQGFSGGKDLVLRISPLFPTNIVYHIGTSICRSATFRISCLNTLWNNSLRDNIICIILIVLGFLDKAADWGYEQMC